MIYASELRELLSYDFDTGSLFWLKREQKHFASYASYRRWNSRYAGKAAGNNALDGNGRPYRKITIKGRSYSAHRVIWAIVKGFWPVDQIDHKDRNPMNNRWENIREASSFLNMNNRGIQTNNISGVQGVSWCKKLGKWRVRPMINGKRKSGGYFSDIDLAAMESLEMRAEAGYFPINSHIDAGLAHLPEDV